MIGNTGTSKNAVARSLDESFAVFDRLPRALRTALNEANFKYDPAWIAEQWRTNRRERSAKKFAKDMQDYLRDFERTL